MEPASLFAVLVSFQRLGDRQQTMGHQLVERLDRRLRRLPRLRRLLKTAVKGLLWLWCKIRG